MKAIDTIYKGYKFRSRLEARWAVFFDALEIKYQYELEGFDLGVLGLYLPDFFIGNSIVEIKPLGFGGSIIKFVELSKIKPVFLFEGSPGFEDVRITSFANGLFMAGEFDIFDIPHPFGCKSLVVKNKSLRPPTDANTFAIFDDKLYRIVGDVGGNVTIRDALTKARQARFEHGDSPRSA